MLIDEFVRRTQYESEGHRARAGGNMEQGGDRAARVPMIRKSSYERCPLRSVSLPGTDRTDLDRSDADRTDRYDDLVVVRRIAVE